MRTFEQEQSTFGYAFLPADSVDVADGSVGRARSLALVADGDAGVVRRRGAVFNLFLSPERWGKQSVNHKSSPST